MVSLSYWCSDQYSSISSSMTWTVGSSACVTKLADDPKLWGAVDTPWEQDAIHRDIDRLEQWVHVNLMRFNKSKCKVLHLGCGNHHHQNKQGGDSTESSPVSNVPSQPRKPTKSWAVSKEAQPEGQGRLTYTSALRW